MKTNEVSNRSWWIDWTSGLFLFLATVLVVVWQNSRLGVLWDLSYVLENSYRISLGDVPYRDFPFPYPPLTFLIQAEIIKLTGRVFWHHIAYCAVMGGLATVLTWRIIVNLLRTEISCSRSLALVLSLPAIVLGIYSIYPHPFYDPDCTLAILFSVQLLQRLELKPLSWWRGLFAGVALVIPAFVKQNTGLVFLGSAGLALLALGIAEIWRRRSLRPYVLVTMGAILAVALALLLIQSTAGLKNYWHWTIQFAGARRTPARAEMLGIYQDKMLVLWIVLLFLGALALWFSRNGSRSLALVSALLMAAPFTWPTIYLLREHDASERAERLLAIWPVLLVFSFIVAIVRFRRRRGMSLVLPFILIGTIHGAFMSQQVWGSTYAIWPLFMILLASTLSSVRSKQSNDERLWMLWPLAALTVLSLLISGGFYIWSHERLVYANLDEGALKRSSVPELRGLTVRGDWLPNFEQLVSYAEAKIPRDEGILIIPGEDLFYYTTARRPQFPVLLFDRTVNPYLPAEILKLARERNIQWVIVKQDLQDEDEELEKGRDELTEILEQEFEQVDTLNNYEIYERSNSRDDDQDR